MLTYPELRSFTLSVKISKGSESDRGLEVFEELFLSYLLFKVRYLFSCMLR